MSSLNISVAEWEIMNVLWERSPRLVSEIVESLQASQGWRPSTSRTLLRRLVAKGAVGAATNRRPLQYEPLIGRAECVREESRSLLQRVFGGQPAEMLVQLVEETPLSAEEIRRLRKILLEKGRKP